MVQIIKTLWNKWEALKTWQQIALVIPFVLLTSGILMYMLSPIKSKRLDKEILKHNKKATEKHVETIVKEKEESAKKQKEYKEKRLEVAKKVKEKEDEAKKIIKKINDADDNIAKLMGVHVSLNARNKQ